ncbi:MAG: LPS export ABC transporter permease LptF [Deltaproteobacteria bacterium]
MGKILQRYLAVEIGGSFLAGLSIFTFILLIARILDLMDLVLSRGVPGLEVVKLFALILPSFLELTIPMAMLLGVVVAFGRLSSDGELTALRASGISVAQMIGPVVQLAAVVTVIALALAIFVRPWANRKVEDTVYEIAKTRATAALREKVFNTDFGGMVIYVDTIDEDNTLGGIMLSDQRDSYRRTTVLASKGRIVPNEARRTVYLQLTDGTSLSFHGGQGSYDKTDFATLEVNLDLDRQLKTSGGGTHSSKPSQMTWQQLLASRKARLAIGDAAIEETVEIHRKFSLAAASMLLALLGIPLGMQKSRSVRARGMAVSIGVILLYYLMMSGSITMARRAVTDAAVAIWLPNAVLAVAAVWMLVRATRGRWLYPPLLGQAANALGRLARDTRRRGRRKRP